MKKVLFVCTGNTCRSPMAMAVFNDFAKKKGLDICAFSRGLCADGSGISENAKAVLERAGTECPVHTSATVSQADIDEADYVIGISSNHAARLMAEFPKDCGKIYAFPFDVPDPYGGSVEVYGASLEVIRRGIEMIVKELFADG